MQGCSPQEADTVKEAVATLKRLCRQRTVLTWKEWREAIETGRRQPTQQVRCLSDPQQPSLVSLSAGTVS